MQLGDKVCDSRDHSRIGAIIDGPQDRQGCVIWRVRWEGGGTAWMADYLLEPFRAVRDLFSLLQSGAFGGMEDFVRNFTHRKLLNPVDDTLYTLNASRTQLLPHQFKPLTKFLDSIHRRYLIADEVGLGKTIEAGIILSELRARNALGGVLVVCPNHLRDKWQGELFSRFDERFEILAARQDWMKLITHAEQFGTETTRCIIGHKTLASRRIWEATAENTPAFDLLIVDEAHHFKNPETFLRRILGDLVDACGQLLLLTATPLQTGSDNLLSLLRLLDHQAFQSREMYRLRLDTNTALVRGERLLRSAAPADPAGALIGARDALGTLSPYPVQLFGLNENGRLSSLLDRLDRAAAASECRLGEVADIAAEVRDLNLLSPYVTRTRKSEVQGSCVRVVETISPDLTPEERRFYDIVVRWIRSRIRRAHGEGPVMFLSRNIERQLASSLPAFARHLRHLAKEPRGGLFDRPPRGLLQAADEIRRAPDTKADRLVRLLRELQADRPSAKSLVFASFHGTLRYLSRVLSDAGIDHEVIHGAVPMAPGDPRRDERGRRVARFLRDSRCSVLLSSNVGGEGLDLQRASVVVNYDLPWNPATVEQRIGRVDRFGQQEQVIQVRSFVLPGTVEDVIYGRLFARLRLFEVTIGEFAEVLGPIMDDLSAEFLRTDLTPEEQEEQLRQAEWRIENERQNLDAIMAHEHELVAFDDDFAEQLKRLDRQGQTIRPSDLYQVIRGVLNRYFPHCRIQPIPEFHTVTSSDGSHAVYEIVVDAKLRSLIQAQLKTRDSSVYWRILRQVDSDGLRVTFDGEVAERDSSLELLTSRHPLVRLVVGRQNAADFHRLAAIRVAELPGEGYPPGLLILFDAEFSMGTQHRRFLKPVWVANGSLETGDSARVLLRTALDRGSSCVPEQLPPPDVLGNMLRLAEDVADADLQRIVARIIEREGVRIRPRVAEIRERFGRRIDRQQDRLGNMALWGQGDGHAKRKQRIQQYIKRMERERDARVRELTEAPPPELHLEAVGAAWLEFGP
jgi:ATP-dependent helicase HepA